MPSTTMRSILALIISGKIVYPKLTKMGNVVHDIMYVSIYDNDQTIIGESMTILSFESSFLKCLRYLFVLVWMLILALLIPESLTCKFLYDVAKDERKHHQNINRPINDVDSFRNLMQPEAYLLEISRNPFLPRQSQWKNWGQNYDRNISPWNGFWTFQGCLKSWFAFFEKDSKFSDQTLDMASYVGNLGKSWFADITRHI